MKANKLIGKWAIRTKPTKDIGDRSYTDSPIFILKANDNHIVCEPCEKWLRSKSPHVLDNDFCDDNWIDYKKLVELPFWAKVLKIIAYKFIRT